MSSEDKSTDKEEQLKTAFQQKQDEHQRKIDQINTKKDQKVQETKSRCIEAARQFINRLGEIDQKTGDTDAMISHLQETEQELDGILSSAHENGLQEIANLKKKQREENFRFIDELKLLRKEIREELENEQKGKYAFIVNLKAAGSQRSVILDKRRLSQVASRLRREYDVTLQGIDDNLTFIMETNMSNKQRVNSNMSIIRRMLEGLFPSESNGDLDWQSRMTEIPAVLQSLLQPGQRLPVEVSTVFLFSFQFTSCRLITMDQGYLHEVTQVPATVHNLFSDRGHDRFYNIPLDY